jgi:class 3 adenylate cyclase
MTKSLRYVLYLILGSAYSLALMLNAAAHEKWHESEIVTIDSDWMYTKSNTHFAIPIEVGFNLADQLSGKDCCSGEYQNKVKINFESMLGNSKEAQSIAIYLPAIGGDFSVTVNDYRLEVPPGDHSTIGPVLILPEQIVHTLDPILIKINVHGPRTPFSGLWKSAPVVGPKHRLDKIRSHSLFWQSTIPWVSSVLLGFFAAVFIWIYFQTGRKFKAYIWFSFSLLAWAIFFLFLSGVPRDVNYYFSSMSLYPSRTVAGFGLFSLIAVHIGLSERTLYRFSGFFVGCALIQFALAFLGMPTLQKILVIGSGPVSMAPLLYLKGKKKNPFLVLVCCLSGIAFLGQSFDSIKLIDRIIGLNWPLPYLNRVTIAPLLLTSIVAFIKQFSDHFHQLREETLKARGLAKMAFKLTLRSVTDKDFSCIIRPTRRSLGIKRSSLAVRMKDKSYVIKGVSGVSTEAIGSILNLDEHPHIVRAINTGQIQIENLKKKKSEVWATTSCMAVPIPLKPDPEYLLLLSDPIRKEAFNESDMPHLCHFSSALWANLERTKYQEKFLKIFNVMDPNLFTFITQKLESFGSQELKITPQRGIIFFDQKSYCTLMEELPVEHVPIFITEVHNWVTNLAARLGARVISNPGDAYLLEIFSLVNESEELIALRTMELVWMLQESLPILNQTLMVKGFGPIIFRFGAHFGTVAPITVNFVASGLQSVMGDNVNIASRLQSMATPGQILISGDLAKFVSDSFQVRQVPRRFVKGRGRAIDIFEVLGKFETSARSAV